MGIPLHASHNSLAAGRNVKALTGTLAVALLLAGTRWGSYIGAAPLFLTDVLIALALVDRVMGNKKHGVRELTGINRTNPGIILSLFLVYAIFRGLTSFEYGLSFQWLRDLTPLLYGGLAFASASALARSTPAERSKSMKYLWWALMLHLAWVSAIVFSGVSTNAFPRFPGAAVSIFTLRPDVDMAVIGVTAGLLVRRITLGKARKLSILALIVCLASVTQFGSRAGLIAVSLSMLTGLAVSYASLPKAAGKRVFISLLAPLLLMAGMAGLAQTSAGERLLASTFSTATTDAHELNAQGTQRAREKSWEGILDWGFGDPARAVFGSGFGNDFLSQSGVIQFLQGTDYSGVRSPHNWLLGIFARLGLVGVALASILLALLVLNIIKNRATIGTNELLTAASVIVVAFMPVALLGVVLESPFGAVPFWWAAGIVLAISGRSQAPSTGNAPPRPSPDDKKRSGGPPKKVVA